MRTLQSFDIFLGHIAVYYFAKLMSGLVKAPGAFKATWLRQSTLALSKPRGLPWQDNLVALGLLPDNKGQT